MTVNPALGIPIDVSGNGREPGHEPLEPPHLTDLGNAERFVADHGADLRFVDAWHRWLVYDGRRWAADESNERTRRAKATVHGLDAEVAYCDDELRRKALRKHAANSEQRRAIEAMIALAQSERLVAATPDIFDRDPWLVNFPNATLDLRTHEIRPHRREDFLTKLTATPYDPTARHPVFDAFLARVLPDPDVRAFVQRVAGYCLTGDTSEEKLFLVHGPTAGGKSTLLKGLRKALGDYAIVADFSTFLERRHAGPREDLARLAGARLVVSVEVKDGSRLAEGLVKTLVGGDDIAARHLYERTFEFTPTFKLVLASNYRPRASDDDEAFWRRMVEIPFTESLPESERDPEVKRVLCDPAQAGAAILAWAVEGARAWQEDGLRPPAAVRDATAAYREAMDPLTDFILEACVIEAESAVTAKDLRAAYDTWARDNSLRFPLATRAFADRLRARGCSSQRRHGGERWWSGIRLRGILDGDAVTQGDANSHKLSYARAREEKLWTETSPASPASPSDIHDEPDWVRG